MNGIQWLNYSTFQPLNEFMLNGFVKLITTAGKKKYFLSSMAWEFPNSKLVGEFDDPN